MARSFSRTELANLADPSGDFRLYGNWIAKLQSGQRADDRFALDLIQEQRIQETEDFRQWSTVLGDMTTQWRASKSAAMREHIQESMKAVWGTVPKKFQPMIAPYIKGSPLDEEREKVELFNKLDPPLSPPQQGDNQNDEQFQQEVDTTNWERSERDLRFKKYMGVAGAGERHPEALPYGTSEAGDFVYLRKGDSGIVERTTKLGSDIRAIEEKGGRFGGDTPLPRGTLIAHDLVEFASPKFKTEAGITFKIQESWDWKTGTGGIEREEVGRQAPSPLEQAMKRTPSPPGFKDFSNAFAIDKGGLEGNNLEVIVYDKERERRGNLIKFWDAEPGFGPWEKKSEKTRRLEEYKAYRKKKGLPWSRKDAEDVLWKSYVNEMDQGFLRRIATKYPGFTAVLGREGEVEKGSPFGKNPQISLVPGQRMRLEKAGEPSANIIYDSANDTIWMQREDADWRPFARYNTGLRTQGWVLR